MARIFLIAVLVLVASSALAVDPLLVTPTGQPLAWQTCQPCQPQQAWTWGQPGQWQRKHYGTPLRDCLFGKCRFVPTGPPQPYLLVPGTIVFPRVVPPTITYPEIPAPKVSQ